MAKKRPRVRRGKTSITRRDLAFFGGALALLIAVGAGFAFAFGGGGSEPVVRAPLRQTPVVSTDKEVAVDVVDSDYAPHMLTVTKGATVTWNFKGSLPHNVTEDQGAFDSGTLGRGDSWQHTFDTTGTFAYYCTIHHAMLGTVKVVE